MGKTDYDFYPKELAGKYQADDKRIMESGETEDIEESYIQDGIEVIVQTVKTPIKDEKGKIVGILGIFWDITKRKRAEDNLKKYNEQLEEQVEKRTAELRMANVHLRREITERRRTEEMLREYQKAVEGSQDMIAVVDQNYNYLIANNAFLKYRGMDREQVVGRSAPEVLGKNVFEKVVKKNLDTCFQGEVVQYEMKHMYSVFGERDLLVSYFPIEGPEGVKRVVSVIQDITERKRVEEALLRSQNAAKRLAQENAIVAEIGQIVSSTLNIEEVYEHFAEEVRKLIPFDRISVNVINPDRTSITIAYAFGIKVGDIKEGDVLPLDDPFNENIVSRRQGVFIQPEDESELAKGYPHLVPHFRAGIRSMMTVPLISKDQVIGLLHFQSLKPNCYTELNLRLAEKVGNQIAGVIANAQLFAEYKQMQKALKKSEERFKDLYHNAPIGYHEYSFSKGGRITQVNRTELEMLGYTEEEILGRYPWDFIVEEISPELVKARLESDFLPGRTIERTFRRKDGTTFPALIHERFLRDDGEQIIGIRSAIQDITERKLAEEILKRNQEELIKKNKEIDESRRSLQLALEELEKAYKELKTTQSKILQQEKMASIGQLAAGVAHEINNPMAFISSNLGTLGKYVHRLTEFIQTQSEVIQSLNTSDAVEGLKRKQKELKLDYITEDIKGLITESLDGSERVKKIVQGLRSFARMDEAEHKSVDINECIESTLNIVWNELKYNATLKKDYGNIPLTKCYPQQMNQVFMNLLINAIHSIEKQGEIAIKTRDEDGSILIAISDTGHGIPQENLNRIFEPFFTTKEVGKGTGLGLSITYDIVQRHNGEITVESEVGKGTTFTIRLPIV